MAKSSSKSPIIQSGVVPYRFRLDGLMQVMLVTSTVGDWIVPKGNIEEGLSAQESARKEAREEAGVIGADVGSELGTYDYQKDDRTYRVRLFSMRVARVMSSWDEMETRRREWVSVDEAIRRVPLMQLRDVLDRFELTMQRQLAV